MFLVVFVTLVISIIGLFAQVFALQTAKINQTQVGVMQTMLQWHGSAVTLGKTNTAATFNAVGLTGCRLTLSVYLPAIPPYAPAICPSGALSASGLAQGYSTAHFSFYSIAFQATTPATTNYVITYAHDVDNLGDLMLPDQSGFTVGLSLPGLRQQFARSAPIYITYGSVTSTGVMTADARSSGIIGADNPPQLTYSVPLSIPVGSIAVLSVAQ